MNVPVESNEVGKNFDCVFFIFYKGGWVTFCNFYRNDINYFYSCSIFLLIQSDFHYNKIKEKIFS